jgi:hypothetical protein
MRYRVHRFDIDMSRDQRELERFLNSLEGEVVAIIPSVNPKFTPGGMGAKVRARSLWSDMGFHKPDAR